MAKRRLIIPAPLWAQTSLWLSSSIAMVTSTSDVAEVISEERTVFVDPLSQGYWKNHSSLWPVSSLILGGFSYTQDELLGIFNSSPKGDATLILAHQLIAAKLNVANGSIFIRGDDSSW